jgi:hypothetical protein
MSLSANLVIWMVESGQDSFVLAGMFGPHDSLLAGPGGEGKTLDINGSDLRELAHLGLIRPTTGDGFDLTNDGRMVYERLVNAAPPDERWRVGF